jgi:hypothetical protein
VAGLASWLGGEVSRGVIQPPLHEIKTKGMILRVATHHDEAVADAQNAGLAFGLMGVFLGAGLGLAGGLARRSGRAAASSGLLGLVLGAAATAGLSVALLPVYTSAKERDPDALSRDIVLPLIVHVGIWSAVGAAGGLALGIGLGERRRLSRTALGGLVGATAGAVAYELVGAALFPFAGTAQPVSTTWGTRLLARLAVTTLAAAGAVLGLSEPRRPPGSPAP